MLQVLVLLKICGLVASVQDAISKIKGHLRYFLEIAGDI